MARGALWDYGAISEALARREGTLASISDWVDQMCWVFGTNTVEDALAVTRRMTLDGVIDKVTCPILVAHGKAIARYLSPTPCVPTRVQSTATAAT